MRIKCCKGCQKRRQACWDYCKQYQTELKQVRKENEKERKARYLDSALRTHHYTSR